MISVKSSLQNVTCGRCDAKPSIRATTLSVRHGTMLAAIQSRLDGCSRKPTPGVTPPTSALYAQARRSLPTILSRLDGGFSFPRYTVQRSGT